MLIVWFPGRPKLLKAVRMVKDRERGRARRSRSNSLEARNNKNKARTKAAIKKRPRVRERACQIASPLRLAPMNNPMATRDRSWRNVIKICWIWRKSAFGLTMRLALSISLRKTRAGGICRILIKGHNVKTADERRPNVRPLRMGMNERWIAISAGSRSFSSKGSTNWRLIPSPAPSTLPMPPIIRLWNR